MANGKEGWIQPTRNTIDGKGILTSGTKDGDEVQYRIEGVSEEIKVWFTCLVHWKSEGDVFYFYTKCGVTRVKAPRETKITPIW